MNTLYLLDHPDIKGTFLENLFLIMSKEKYQEPLQEYIPGHNEEVISHMSNLEKALYTMAIIYRNKQLEIEQRLNGFGRPLDSTQYPQLKRMHQVCIEKNKTAKRMLWTSIRERLIDHEWATSISYGVRKGFKVVIRSEKPPQESCDYFL